MTRYVLLALAMLTAPAAAQTTATLPVTCNASGSICTQATPVTNPDGTLVGSGGSGTRTTAAGTSDTQAVPVQGVTNGVAVPVVQRGGPSLATGQVSVGTTATLIAAARAGRARVTVAVGAANTCAFGNAGVTTASGFPLQPVAGATITLDTAAALYAACSATTTVSYVETF